MNNTQKHNWENMLKKKDKNLPDPWAKQSQISLKFHNKQIAWTAIWMQGCAPLNKKMKTWTTWLFYYSF